MQFRGLAPVVDVTFWERAFALKLDSLGLSQTPLPVAGVARHSKFAEPSVLLHLDAESFAPRAFQPRLRSFHELRVPGLLVLCNSLRELREAEFAPGEGFFVLAAHVNHKSFEVTFSFWALAAEADGARLGPPAQTAVEVDAALVQRSEGFELATQSALGPVVTDAVSAVDCLSAHLLYHLRRSHPGETRFGVVRQALALQGAGAAELCLQPLELPGPAAELPFRLQRALQLRTLNLRSFLSPEDVLAAQQRLNLRLMKWRLEPRLDLELLARQRVLVLGTGTLGCNFGRALLGYGVRVFTFVDHGAVSPSNLARQSLFGVDDVGAPKAEAARAAMLRISPGADVRGVRLRVPMPGHFVAEERLDEAVEELRQLEELVRGHDVVLNVFDSREARYFPTLLAALHATACLSVGIGFDSFVGVLHPAAAAPAAGQPGCFFCTDCLPPSDTLTDRALDQQCTVSRPGLSPAAVGACAELLVNHLHAGVLGPAPSFLRGVLGGEFALQSFASERFEGCVACSAPVLALFAADRRGFLLRTLNDPRWLTTAAGAGESSDGEEVILLED